MNGTHQDTPHDTSRYIKIHQDTYRIGNYTKSYRKLHVTPHRPRGATRGQEGDARVGPPPTQHTLATHGVPTQHGSQAGSCPPHQSRSEEHTSELLVTIPALAIRTTVPTVALTFRPCPKRSRNVCPYGVRVVCVCAPCVWPWPRPKPRPAAPGAWHLKTVKWHRAPIS